jgi:acetyltransferase-like isoleucine patch superfamily enzyme
LNLGATIQTHLFEDRILKADHLRIGEGCNVGNMGVVLYGTEMQKGSSLGPLSVLMKGEKLPTGTGWIGIPCEQTDTERAPGASVEATEPRPQALIAMGPPAELLRV